MKKKLAAALLAGLMAIGVPCQPGIVPGSRASAAEEDAGPSGRKDNQDVLDALFGRKDGKDGGGKNGSQNAAQENGGEPAGGQAVRTVVEDDYFDVLAKWEKEGIKAAEGFEQRVSPSEFRVQGGQPRLLQGGESEGYDGPVLRWEQDTPEVTFEVQAPQDGLYTFRIDYYPLTDKIMSIERGIKINGEYPYFQARQFELYKVWKDERYPFGTDAMGNDVLPEQKMVEGWITQAVEDPASADDRPLLFYLKKGANTVSLPFISEPMLLGAVTVAGPERTPDYAAYRRAGEERKAPEYMVTVEGERTASKNQPFIRVQTDGNPSTVPFETGGLRLNALGGDSWQISGQSVTWRFEVPEDGDYRIALKYKQNTNTKDTGTDMPVYRTIQIDGALPFEELRRVEFPFTNNWSNKVLADAEGKPYLFRLAKGEHTITMTANDAPYRDTIRTIRRVMDGINELAIELKMATGNTLDTNRDWNLTEQIPDVSERLTGFADDLEKHYEALSKQIGRAPDAAKSMIVSADRLRFLAKEPNALPYRYKQLAEGSGSIMQMLGKSLGRLPNQPLTIDRFYVYAGKELPSAKASVFARLKANVSAFFGSFAKDYSKMGGEGEDTLEIWVNRPRQYVMMMQQLANETFTKKTGIEVSFSLMPDETKLILANAAGNAPDLALSINNVTPFNLAVRDTLTDLTQFPDYGEVAQRFSPGAMLPFRFDGGTYALPETQNFWVLFYRKDILDGLGIPVPDSMEDVKEILPDLQRYGLNFYHPLSATGGMKGFVLTTPLIYQNGGELFKEDGTGTAIDSEEAVAGIKQMTELFTVYNMPLNVPSFYNHFRDGSLPIGIADFQTYIQLTAAAPEIAGLWKIAPLPGTTDENGTVQRWAPGTGQSTVIFKSSKKQKEAWELLKWWTSAETQLQFGNRMQMIYGPTYRWNTANLEAFDEMPWPAEDIKVIQEQWKWLKDIPHIPGDYMLERMISDAWNKVVFNGYNPRRAIEDAVIQTNRELAKKLEEFGYMKNGKLVEPIEVPRLPAAAAGSGEGQVKANETGG